MKSSPNFKNGKFINIEPVNMANFDSYIGMLSKTIKGGEKHRKPSSKIPVVMKEQPFDEKPSMDLRFMWLGHSSVLLELEGKRFLFDPVFSKRASMVDWAGPQRFHSTPFDVTNLPELEAVIISHDHYDHLDKMTIIELAKRKLKFYVPLGMGSLLMDWGVDVSVIKEFDWWEEIIGDNYTIESTPARHFSGRSIFDWYKRLWCSWVLVGKNSRIYFSGDTGIMKGFKEIGNKYGPFNATFLKIAAYDENWPDVHINPEEAVLAHQMLKGKTLVPIHWATFDLAYHSWYRPILRLFKESEPLKIKVVAPIVGEMVNPDEYENKYWWRRLK